MKRIKLWQIFIIALVTVILAAITGFVIWGNNPSPAYPEALTALESDTSVLVEQGQWLVFKPQTNDPSSGFIFYPGGHVQPQAYAPAARAIAEKGYLVVIAPMPVNLAVFAPNVADDIIAAYPEIECWVIGGHSLGGAMAARYASRNPENIRGLILWASYPASSDDLSSSDIAVASIYGSEDGLSDVDTVLGSRQLLPPDTTWVLIEGGNHAGFGYYGPQSGDNPRSITLEAQQDQIVTATLELLDKACE
jgi:hypothetical protein